MENAHSQHKTYYSADNVPQEQVIERYIVQNNILAKIGGWWYARSIIRKYNRKFADRKADYGSKEADYNKQYLFKIYFNYR